MRKSLYIVLLIMVMLCSLMSAIADDSFDNNERDETVTVLGSYDLNLPDQGIECKLTYERHDLSVSVESTDIVCPIIYDLPILSGNLPGVDGANEILYQDYQDFISDVHGEYGVESFIELFDLGVYEDDVMPFESLNKINETVYCKTAELKSGLQYFDGRYMSILFYSSWYDGEIGWAGPYGMTLDLQTGKKDSIADLFGNASEVKERITAAVIDGQSPEFERYADLYDDVEGELRSSLAKMNIAAATEDFFLGYDGTLYIIGYGVAPMDIPIISTGLKMGEDNWEDDIFATSAEGEPYQFVNLDDGTVKITRYCGESSELVIPAELDGRPIRVIGEGAFSDNGELGSVVIPEGILAIEDRAFSGCYMLTDVSLPDSLDEIGEDAFMDCAYDILFTVGPNSDAYEYCANRDLNYVYPLDNTESDSISTVEMQNGIGDIVTFGHYEQDNDLHNGKEPIEWIIIDTDGQTVMLISRYALDSNSYNRFYDSSVTWETCTMREWLNSEFLDEAFSATEQAYLETVTVKADKNPDSSTNPGNDTLDRVFLLSILEAERFFVDEDSRSCTATAYASGKGVFTSSEELGWTADVDTCIWWLRSPGRFGDRAARINGSGSIGYDGSMIEMKTAVRPVIVLRLTENGEVWHDNENDVGNGNDEEDDIDTDYYESQTEAQGYVEAMHDGVMLRLGPSVVEESWCQIDYKEELPVLRTVVDSQGVRWYEVDFGGICYWASEIDVEVHYNTDDPVIEELNRIGVDLFDYLDTDWKSTAVQLGLTVEVGNGEYYGSINPEASAGVWVDGYTWSECGNILDTVGIRGYSDYNILGIYGGMDENEAISILEEAGFIYNDIVDTDYGALTYKYLLGEWNDWHLATNSYMVFLTTEDRTVTEVYAFYQACEYSSEYWQWESYESHYGEGA